jgi:hypothetical protein
MDIVSDDFCGSGGDGGASGDPSDYIGAMDPGSAYGDYRMWLMYDPTINWWSVQGTWADSISYVTVTLPGATTGGAGGALNMDWMGSDIFYPSISKVEIYANTMVGQSPISAGSGELAWFEHSGPGVPCIEFGDVNFDPGSQLSLNGMRYEVGSPDACP